MIKKDYPVWQVSPKTKDRHRLCRDVISIDDGSGQLFARTLKRGK